MVPDRGGFFQPGWIDPDRRRRASRGQLAKYNKRHQALVQILDFHQEGTRGFAESLLASECQFGASTQVRANCRLRQCFWFEIQSRLSPRCATIETARTARDPNLPFGPALVEYDDSEDYGEDRFVLTGRAADGILVLVYTDGDRIRIIAAREATDYEHRAGQARGGGFQGAPAT